MKRGDKVRLTFGPYDAVCTVIEIKDAGAVLECPPTAQLTDDDRWTMLAPNGETLTDKPGTTFLGRAHWPAAEVVT